MTEIIREQISVKLISDHIKKKVYPEKIFWRGRVYQVKQIGLHHITRIGKTLKHIFSVVTDGAFFKLSFDTETLFWTLEEINSEE
jgi:hypothetical protein